MPGSNVLQATMIVPQVVAAVQLSGTVDDAVYVVPAGQGLIVKLVSACNITNDPSLAPAGEANVRVSVSIVPAGASVDGKHRVIPWVPMEPGDAVSVGNLRLGPGDAVYARSDTAKAVDVVITGVVVSSTPIVLPPVPVSPPVIT